MNINATLLVQMLVFMAFVAITMKYIWPPVTRALDARRKLIADGLAAADQGKRDLAAADQEAVRIISAAKMQGAQIIEHAQQQSQRMLEDAKQQAQKEGARLLHLAEDDILQQYTVAKVLLMEQITAIAIAGAEKILGAEIDSSRNERLVRVMIDNIAEHRL